MADRFANGSTANDTGGFGGGRLQNGLDPTHKGFYHGGDIKGIKDKLDYIEGLGTTAIWMTPSFKNKPVQGAPGSESAGYHGYWITDFTQIDPHLGTNAELKSLVDAAHKRGIKVFFDIITNHTADVLDYPQSDATTPAATCPTRARRTRRTRTRRGSPFDDRDYALGQHVPAGRPRARSRTRRRSASRPTRPRRRRPGSTTRRCTTTAARRASPERTASTATSPAGPFSSLDDLWTERPEVVNGMVDIYEQWVQNVGRRRVPHRHRQAREHGVLAAVRPGAAGYAASLGNDDFFMFGEVFDASPEFMSRYTTEGKLQATVDFGFQAVAQRFAQGKATTGPARPVRRRRLLHRRRLQRVLAADVPRQPRHGPHRSLHRGRGLLRRASCSSATSWRTR